MLLLDSTNGVRTGPSYRLLGSTGGSNAGAQPVGASTTAAEQQATDYFVSELESLVRASGPLPQDPQTLHWVMRDAQQKVAAKHPREEALDEELAAAGLITEAKLLAGQAKDPMAMRLSARTLLGQSLIGVASNTALNTGDRGDIEELVISSNYASHLGRGESTLGQELQIVDAGTALSATDKTRLEQQIINSRYAQSLGSGSVAFLKNYLSTIAQLKHNPNDLTTVAAATQAVYLVNYGDALQGLSGAQLDNAIGLGMGMTPDTAPQGAAPEIGKELFSGEQREAIRKIAAKIEELGGANAQVTVLPVLFDPHDGKDGVQQYAVWQVRAPTGQVTYVDYLGRTYSSIDEFVGDNKMGFGRMIVARDGQLSVDAEGHLSLREYDHQKGFWDYVDQYGGYVLAGAAIVGGVILIASGFGAPVGAVLAAGAWSAVLAGGAYGVYKGGSDLVDRSQHGQYVGLGKETAGDYVSIAAGLAAPLGGGAPKAAAVFAEVGQPGRALFVGGAPALAKMTQASSPMLASSARVVGYGANTVNIGAAGYSGYDYATHFDEMTLQQKLQGGVNIVMGGIALLGGVKNVIDARRAANANIPGGVLAVRSNPAGSPPLQPTGVDANGVPLPPTTLGRGRSWSDVARRTDGLIYRQSLANQPGSRVRPLKPSPEETAVRERLMAEPPEGSPIRFTLTTIGPEETIYGSAGTGTKRKNTFTTFAEARAVAATRGGRWINRIVPDSAEPVPITNRRANPDEIMGAVHVDGDGNVLPVAIPNTRSTAWRPNELTTPRQRRFSLREPQRSLTALGAGAVAAEIILSSSIAPHWIQSLFARPTLRPISKLRTSVSESSSLALRTRMGNALAAARAGKGEEAEAIINRILQKQRVLGLSPNSVDDCATLITRLHAVADAKKEVDSLSAIADHPGLEAAQKTLVDRIASAKEIKLKTNFATTPVGGFMRRASFTFNMLSGVGVLLTDLPLPEKIIYSGVSLYAAAVQGNYIRAMYKYKGMYDDISSPAPSWNVIKRAGDLNNFGYVLNMAADVFTGVVEISSGRLPLGTLSMIQASGELGLYAGSYNAKAMRFVPAYIVLMAGSAVGALVLNSLTGGSTTASQPPSSGIPQPTLGTNPSAPPGNPPTNGQPPEGNLPPQPPQPPTQNDAVYTVQPGDSLERIARTHQATMRQIFQLNPDFNPSLEDGNFFTKRTDGERGRDPDLIHPGDHVILPPASQTATKRNITSRSFA